MSLSHRRPITVASDKGDVGRGLSGSKHVRRYCRGKFPSSPSVGSWNSNLPRCPPQPVDHKRGNSGMTSWTEDRGSGRPYFCFL
jgi:hypothetical protein